MENIHCSGGAESGGEERHSETEVKRIKRLRQHNVFKQLPLSLKLEKKKELNGRQITVTDCIALTFFFSYTNQEIHAYLQVIMSNSLSPRAKEF